MALSPGWASSHMALGPIIPVEPASVSGVGSWLWGWLRGVAIPASTTHAETPSGGYNTWVQCRAVGHPTAAFQD